MIADYRGKAVFVTGGTAGVGLATALAFARRGATCAITYRWGSADEDDVRRRFAEVGGPEPMILQADVSDPADVGASLEAVRARFDRVEALVSNASAAVVVDGLDAYSARALHKTLDYGAWPMWEHMRQIRERFGAYPRYVIGMSSTGPDHFHVGYDFVAATKSVLETLCRYLTYRLRDEDVRVNVIRSRAVRTASFHATFGAEAETFGRRYMEEREFVPAEEVADAALALASGLFDAVRGQVITVDRGTTFGDSTIRRYGERDGLDLRPAEGGAPAAEGSLHR